MPPQHIPCPLCPGVDLVQRPLGRFECTTQHGYFTMAVKPGDGVYVEVVLRHESSGIEFGFGSYTPDDWRAFQREAGLAIA